jgi:hypothetical protein
MGKNHPERIKGWYNLVGGGAGFLLVESADPRDVTALLQPYMDLMSFDVRGVYQLDYQERIQELRRSRRKTRRSRIVSRSGRLPSACPFACCATQ